MTQTTELESETSLWLRYTASTEQVQKRKIEEDLVSFYQTYINGIVKKIHPKLYPQPSKDDLKSYAYDGLLTAIRLYTPCDVPFRAYAQKRVRGAVFDGLRAESNFSRGDERRMFHFSALEELNKNNQNDTTYIENLLGCDENPNHSLDISDAVNNILEYASVRDRQMLTLYFLSGMKLKDMAKRFGKSESYLSQLVSAAVEHTKTGYTDKEKEKFGLPVFSICAIENCDNEYHVDGYCKLHHSQFKMFGDPLQIEPEFDIDNIIKAPIVSKAQLDAFKNRQCQHDNCSNRVYRLNMCEQHYEASIKSDHDYQQCSESGCQEESKIKGYCEKHRKNEVFALTE